LLLSASLVEVGMGFGRMLGMITAMSPRHGAWLLQWYSKAAQSSRDLWSDVLQCQRAGPYPHTDVELRRPRASTRFGP
jgi:hypothetical protein